MAAEYFTQMLDQAAERYAVEQGANELRLGVLSANQTARRLYLRASFNKHMEVLAKRFNRRELRRAMTLSALTRTHGSASKIARFT